MDSRIVVGLGEVLWDLFPEAGQPEGSKRRHRRPGGAPANVAYHASQLGDHGVVVSRVGHDALGDELIAFLSNRNVDTQYLESSQHEALPTGTVQIEFAEGEPTYTITDAVAWDAIAWTDDLHQLARTCDAVCFSTLAQRSELSRRSIRTFVASVPAGSLRVLDVNLRAPFFSLELVIDSIRLANVVKLSAAEEDWLRATLGVSDLPAHLISTFGVDLVCLTRGADGASLISSTHRSRREADQIDTSEGDAVGVGDAFVAAMTHCLIRGLSLDDTLTFANGYAGKVAARKGAMPTI